MSFVSYAQNLEDVMLWRALKHVDKGFYIDVGANDPSTDSVTKAFYERGWHGINIEPLPSHHADLVHDRPRDINLQCAAGDSQGEVDLWECDVRGWATASAEVAAQHEAEGHTGSHHRVKVTTLSSICEQFATTDINFLKIDVEGFEKAVIDGMDFSRFRPWILVIEATKPNSTIEIHDEWEGAILAADYAFAYGDGLNRFYLAHEQVALLPLLRYPPNVFDDYVPSQQKTAQEHALQADAEARQAEARAQQAGERAAQAEKQEKEAEAKAQQAEAKAQQAEAKAQQAELALSAMVTSHSWLVTAPLRKLARLFREM